MSALDDMRARRADTAKLCREIAASHTETNPSIAAAATVAVLMLEEPSTMLSGSSPRMSKAVAL